MDMAKSRYLTIDVQRSVIVVGTDGYLTKDVRFNRPAKDGEIYSNEGIYTFTVRNLYTDEETEKTIYVGSSSYLRALSATGMSIEELNSEIEKGSIIHEDGTIEAFVPEVIASEETPEPAESEPQPVVDVPTESHISEENTTTEVDVTLPADDNAISNEVTIIPFVIGAIAIVVILSVIVSIKRKKIRAAKLDESIAVDEEEVN